MSQLIQLLAVNRIRELLVRSKQSLGVAESVTAGQLQEAFSLAEKAMDFFQGGITVYNIGQKSRHLGVDPIHAASCNSVSKKVASEMSINVCKMFSSDWGIAITGYASPVPEEGVLEVYAYYAVSAGGVLVASDIIKPAVITNPKLVRDDYVSQLLNIFIKIIVQNSVP